jgi:hypothetical protein
MTEPNEHEYVHRLTAPKTEARANNALTLPTQGQWRLSIAASVSRLKTDSAPREVQNVNCHD